MEICEAFLIKKTNYREADIIATFFTKEFGKLSGVARNAKSSKKRFGGRLEPFVQLRVEIKINENKFNNINDLSIIRAYSGIMENLESFAIGTFIIELIDSLVAENVSSVDLFDETVRTFEKVEKNENLLPELLKFQLKALELCGYKPSFENGKEIGSFSISKGQIVSANEKNSYNFYLDIMKNPETMDIFLGKVANNIKVLTKYTEYHTGKQLKSSKFLEELNL